jgi:hypothetical protein
MNELQQKLRSRQPLVGAAVGSGMTARAAESGGADFLMVLNAGHYRLQGCSSIAALLPFADANALTWRVATESVLPRVNQAPVFLGVCAQDPHLNWSDLQARLNPHISYLSRFCAGSGPFPQKERRRSSRQPCGGGTTSGKTVSGAKEAIFLGFLTTPLLQSPGAAYRLWCAQLRRPQGQGHQPPVTKREDLLQRKGAAHLHIDSAHAHAHLGGDLQEL